ncbi:MAG: MATE family efflux transporter [Prevotellaceae bacterium]|nr:MATE family efflux transporter [Prevotellaceae bacterium]
MRPSAHSLLHPELTNGNIVKAMIAFSAPIIVSCLFQQLYNAVDASIVGHYLGENSLAAIGACAAIFELMVGFGLGFGNGLSIVVARAYGAHDDETLKKSVAASIVVSLAVSVLITLLGLFFLRDLLTLLDTPEEILDEAHGYIGLVAAFAAFCSPIIYCQAY